MFMQHDMKLYVTWIKILKSFYLIFYLLLFFLCIEKKAKKRKNKINSRNYILFFIKKIIRRSVYIHAKHDIFTNGTVH